MSFCYDLGVESVVACDFYSCFARLTKSSYYAASSCAVLKPSTSFTFGVSSSKASLCGEVPGRLLNGLSLIQLANLGIAHKSVRRRSGIFLFVVSWFNSWFRRLIKW